MTTMFSETKTYKMNDKLAAELELEPRTYTLGWNTEEDLLNQKDGLFFVSRDEAGDVVSDSAFFTVAELEDGTLVEVEEQTAVPVEVEKIEVIESRIDEVNGLVFESVEQCDFVMSSLVKAVRVEGAITEFKILYADGIEVTAECSYCGGDRLADTLPIFEAFARKGAQL